jgi:arylsulfatase A-like enzyme
MADVRATLAALGQLDDTLMICVGDRGPTGAGRDRREPVPDPSAIRVPFHLSWPAMGLTGDRTDDRLVAGVDIAPTILDAAGLMGAGVPAMDGHSLLGSYRRERLLIEWWREKARGAPRSWASHLTGTRQYTEYYDTVLDRSGNPVGSGRVVFREYYDLVRDPGRSDNLLRHATPGAERDLGIPVLAAQLALDRASAGTVAAPVSGRPPSP